MSSGADYREVEPGVFYTSREIVVVGEAEIAFLKDRAAFYADGISRLCTHPRPGDPMQSTLTVCTGDAYFRPRRYATPHSFHLIEGRAIVAVFDHDGSLDDAAEVGDAASGSPFYWRIIEDVWYGLAVESYWLIFFETVHCEQTEESPVWAPGGADRAAAMIWANELRERCRRLLASQRR